MKLLQSSLILILAASLSACPSDDDPKPTTAEVEGTYHLTFYEHTASHLEKFDDEWEPKILGLRSKATDINMTVTFRSDGTFLAEGGYIGASADPTTQEHAMYSPPEDFRSAGRWKIEGGKLYISDDRFLGYPFSLNSSTRILYDSEEEFPLDGLNIVGVTDTKITLELIATNEHKVGGILTQWKYIGTVVLEK